jgi:glutamine synthetase
LLYLFHPQTKKPLYCDSRSVLKQVTDDFGEMGLVPYSGVEFEFFCFKGKVKRGG